MHLDAVARSVRFDGRHEPVFHLEPLEPRLMLSVDAVHVGLVAPDILAITVRDQGQVVKGDIVPYAFQPGDSLPPTYDPWVKGSTRWIYRNGQKLGIMIGDDQDTMRQPDRFVGPRISTSIIDKKSSYDLVPLDGGNDPAIEAVYRKTTPVETGNYVTGGSQVSQMQHTVYLDFAADLSTGKLYQIQFDDSLINDYFFINSPTEMRSEAVHVNQIGFRPDDPSKLAFLSQWMGNAPDGGGLDYPAGMTFHILDHDNQSVFSGNVVLDKLKTQPEDNVTASWTGFASSGLFMYEDGDYNHSKVDVWRMDFSSFDQPGEYRVYVEGIGTSYPFEIADDVWSDSFEMVMLGIYHHRSGMELQVNGGEWIRPRNFHPDDGVVIHEVTAKITDGVSLSNLHNYKTGHTVPDAWGGYHDAGDWDRRVQHLLVTFNLLDLAETFPTYFGSLDLPVPDSGDVLPDARYDVALPGIIDEAMWNLDFYRRMQEPHGGVRGGVESASHPRDAEVSWMETLEVYAFAPDTWSTFKYAAVAAKASVVLQRYSGALSQMYRQSAIDAMSWAEGQPDKTSQNRTRAWAAAELYRLTGDTAYQTIFDQASILNPSNNNQELKGDEVYAAYTYAITSHPTINSALKNDAKKEFLSTIDRYFLAAVDKSAFNFLKHSYAPHGWGIGTEIAGPGENVVRAFVLSGDAKYIEAAIDGSGIGLGANPGNWVYTTGHGDQPVTTILHLDAQNANQTMPAGVPIYGTIRPADDGQDWPVTWHLVGDQALEPSYYQWPIMENYHGFWLWPPMNEYTVQQTMATNGFVWGFLAAMDGMTRPAAPQPLDAVPVFYSVFSNNSVGDGFDPAINVDDNGAIAGDVLPLLSGASGWANYTIFSRGLNGVMIDVAFPADVAAANDLVLRIGDSDDPATWSTYQGGVWIDVREGGGLSGLTRIAIGLPDGVVANQWLEVTILSDAHGGSLGLATDSVFYVGSLIGDVNHDGQVNVTDRQLAQSHLGDGTLTGDANGDGQIDGNDLISVEENFGATGAGVIGDANGDEQVDGNDLISVEESFGGVFVPATVGDVNLDGVVDQSDIDTIHANLGEQLATIHAPVSASAAAASFTPTPVALSATSPGSVEGSDAEPTAPHQAVGMVQLSRQRVDVGSGGVPRQWTRHDMSTRQEGFGGWSSHRLGADGLRHRIWASANDLWDDQLSPLDLS